MSQKVLKKKDLTPLKLREVSSPGGVSSEINRLKRQITALLQKLDLDSGVFDTDYEDTINSQE